jgi:hypothetical protein
MYRRCFCQTRNPIRNTRNPTRNPPETPRNPDRHSPRCFARAFARVFNKFDPMMSMNYIVMLSGLPPFYYIFELLPFVKLRRNVQSYFVLFPMQRNQINALIYYRHSKNRNSSICLALIKSNPNLL